MSYKFYGFFVFICTLCFSNNFPTHQLPENFGTRSIKQSVTQIDVTRFGKFKALANYSKVGTHTHMKPLFVCAWNLSGGLSCVKTSILTVLQSSSLLCFGALSGGSPKVLPPCPPPPAPLEGSLKHKQTVLFSPPGLFATFISDKVSGKRLDLTQCSHSSVSQYTISQKLFFFFLLPVDEISCDERCS